MLKINFSANKVHKSPWQEKLRHSTRGLALAKGFSALSCHTCGVPLGQGCQCCPTRGVAPIVHQAMSLWPLSTGEEGSVKSAVAQGVFTPPPPSPNLFGFAGRAKQGLQRLMKKAAGSSYKIKRLEQIGVPSLGKQKLRAAQGERCADGSQGTPCGRR